MTQSQSETGEARVSVLIPARNSASTLLRAVQSVIAQSYPSWELLIGVGPSADETASVAQDIVSDFPTRKLYYNDCLTAAAARNSLISQASANHVLFLDADDTLDIDHLRRLADAMSFENGIAATGYRRLLPDGSILTEHDIENFEGRPMTFLGGMPTALHGILFPRQLIEQCGGFDEDLETNEDWDLCLRLEQAGASIIGVPGISANYWITAGSLTSNGAQLHKDRMTVISRFTQSAKGLSITAAERTQQSIRTTLWSGARMVAEGANPQCLLNDIVRFEAPVTEHRDGGAALLEGLAIGLAVHFDQIPARYQKLHHRLSTFLQELEDECGDPGLSRALLNELQKELARLDSRWTSFQLGTTKVIPANPFSADIKRDQLAERIVVRVPYARPRSKFTFSFDAEFASGRRPLSLTVKRLVEGRGPKTNDNTRLPVLMYHGVSDDGPDDLAAWRLSTANFREQMRLLRQGGFRSFDPANWHSEATMSDYEGKPVVLTFDDGLADFASNALPILQEFGFSAHIFVVAGKIGTSASWDAAYGPPSKLMSEADLRRVIEAGTSVGSHMWSHTNLFRLTGKQIREEAYRSAAMLGDLMGRKVQSVAPPYGAYDPAIADILEECGYDQIFGIRHDFSPVRPSFRDIPRLDINGQMSSDEFADLLGIEVVA